MKLGRMVHFGEIVVLVGVYAKVWIDGEAIWTQNDRLCSIGWESIDFLIDREAVWSKNHGL